MCFCRILCFVCEDDGLGAYVFVGQLDYDEELAMLIFIMSCVLFLFYRWVWYSEDEKETGKVLSGMPIISYYSPLCASCPSVSEGVTENC